VTTRIFFDKPHLPCPPYKSTWVCPSRNDQKDIEFVRTPEKKNIQNMFIFCCEDASQNVKKKATMALCKYLRINDSTSIGKRAVKFSKNRSHKNKKTCCIHLCIMV
jgi:hypothetical protein